MIAHQEELVERAKLAGIRRWVVKIGSALATNNGQGLNTDSIDRWARQLCHLAAAGKEILLVSSGSVAEGIVRLGWKHRPRELHALQAAAAVGQMGLVQAYESSFQRHGMQTAQILLTHGDLADRQRYINARSTLLTLLRLRVVPVINENDTVATDEIRFGDNDTLAGLVANLVEAGLLVILTDQPGLYDADPRLGTGVRLIRYAKAGDPALAPMAGDGGALGRGGMKTKLSAALLAARSGTATVIASGNEDNVLQRIGRGETIGTLLRAQNEPLTARKMWLAGTLRPRGRLQLDDGAVRVLTREGRSLLAVGVIAAEGNFERGDLVVCVDPQGREIARGLVNYSLVETRRILGKPTAEIAAILGYVDEPELVHRDNLVLT